MSRRATVAWALGVLALSSTGPTRAAPGPATAQQPAKPTPSLIAPTRSPLVAPGEAVYDLQPTADGGYVYRDFRFDAIVAPDGHVTFKDIHLRIETRVVGVPLRQYRTDNGKGASLFEALRQQWTRDPKRPIPPAWPDYPYDPRETTPGLGRLPVRRPAPISIVGSFDLTDEVMKAVGQGWYRYEKAKFLSATFEFRLKLATARHRKLLHQALEELPRELEKLWNDPGYTPREKRAILCQLWSEVNVDDQEERVAADGILTWIRRRIPAEDPAAYGDAEIRACSTESKRPFRPYDPTPSMGTPPPGP